MDTHRLAGGRDVAELPGQRERARGGSDSTSCSVTRGFRRLGRCGDSSLSERPDAPGSRPGPVPPTSRSVLRLWVSSSDPSALQSSRSSTLGLRSCSWSVAALGGAAAERVSFVGDRTLIDRGVMCAGLGRELVVGSRAAVAPPAKRTGVVGAPEAPDEVGGIGVADLAGDLLDRQVGLDQ
jgi:hypothetical protein